MAQRLVLQQVLAVPVEAVALAAAKAAMAVAVAGALAPHLAVKTVPCAR